MANINIENISDLDLNGNDLFQDSESFITELDDDSEQLAIMGGIPTNCGFCTMETCTPTLDKQFALKSDWHKK